MQCDILKKAILNAQDSVYILFELIDNLDEELMDKKQMDILCKLNNEICNKSLEYYENGQLLESKNSFGIIWWLKISGFEKEADQILHDIFNDKKKTIKFVKNFFRKDKTQKYDCYEAEDDEDEVGVINSTIDLDLMRNSLEEIYLSSDFEQLAEDEIGPICALLYQLPDVTCFRDKEELEFMKLYS